jgi:hypothetical protein
LWALPINVRKSKLGNYSDSMLELDAIVGRIGSNDP